MLRSLLAVAVALVPCAVLANHCSLEIENVVGEGIFTEPTVWDVQRKPNRFDAVNITENSNITIEDPNVIIRGLTMLGAGDLWLEPGTVLTIAAEENPLSACQANLTYNGCDSNPCQHNGVCSSLHIDYDFECECPPTYHGEVCETRRVCESSPCQNNGACVPDATDQDAFTCSCLSGFSGASCEIGDGYEGADAYTLSFVNSFESLSTGGMQLQDVETQSSHSLSEAFPCIMRDALVASSEGGSCQIDCEQVIVQSVQYTPTPDDDPKTVELTFIFVDPAPVNADANLCDRATSVKSGLKAMASDPNGGLGAFIAAGLNTDAVTVTAVPADPVEESDSPVIWIVLGCFLFAVLCVVVYVKFIRKDPAAADSAPAAAAAPVADAEVLELTTLEAQPGKPQAIRDPTFMRGVHEAAPPDEQAV